MMNIQTTSRFLAVGLAFVAVLIADAREPTSFPTRRVDDSTGIVWQQWNQLTTTTTTTPTGATLLPYTMPPGNYFNSAAYPLLLTVTPPGPSCYDFSVYVNGEFIARARDDCELTNTSVTVLVPSNSSFGITGGNTRVTALSNNATWQAIGVDFDYYAGATSVKRVSGDCAWTDYTTRWINIYTGVTRQVTTQLYYQCFDSSGGGP